MEVLVELLDRRPAAALSRRAVAAIAAVLIWIVTGACERQLEKNPMPPTNSVRFELPSGVVVVDPAALESMKTALQDFVDSPAYPAPFLELRDGFRAELKASAPWISGELAGVGVWRLENEEGRLTLVRYPSPAKATSYLYHAALSKTDSGWKVASFEQERELGPQ